MPAALVPVDRLPWDQFLTRFDWRQGEHVSLLGPTGGGKTTLAVQLLHRRTYVVAIGTKPQDDTLDYLRKRERYKRVPNLPTVVQAGRPTRLIVWPKVRTLDRTAKRAIANEVRVCLDRAYSMGGWTVFADELSYLTRTLGLGPELIDIWQQGRSNHVSLIGCSQRPRFIPLDAYSAASHLFLWRTNDRHDVARLSGLNGADADAVKRAVQTLGRHEVLYVSTRTGAMAVTVAPKLQTA